MSIYSDLISIAERIRLLEEGNIQKPIQVSPASFDSVSLLSALTGGVSTTLPIIDDKPLTLYLHGTGSFTSLDDTGDQYSAVGTSLSEIEGEPFRFAVVNEKTSIRLNPFAGAPGTGPSGQWMGWIVNGVFFPYAEYRLEALLRWVQDTYPTLSKTKRSISGSSIGANGALAFAMRRPSEFALCKPSRPTWRFYGYVGLIKAVERMPNGSLLERRFTVDNSPPVAGTNLNLAQYKDMVAYAANPANKLPFIAWGVGSADTYTPFSDHIAAVAALRATNRGFAFGWDSAGHSSSIMDTTINKTYMPTMFELGIGYPILTNSSHDKVPGIDPVGGINIGFKWRNVIESENMWSCEIANILGETTVTVSPYSDIFTKLVTSKTVTIPANTWMKVEFSTSI